MTLRRTSVAGIVILALVTVTTLLLLVVGAVNYVSLRNGHLAALREQLDTEADQLVTGLAIPLWNMDEVQIGRIMESTMRHRNISGIVVKTKGLCLILTRDARWGVVSTAQEFAVEGSAVNERPVLHDGMEIGTVRVGVTSKFVEAELHQTLLLSGAAIVLLDLALVLSLSGFLWRLVLRPLQAVSRYASAVRGGGGAELPAVEGRFRGELEDLRCSIQEMVELLQARYHDLQISEERLQLAVEAAKIGIWDWDVRNDVLSWDNSMYALYGLQRSDFSGAYQAWVQTIHPDDKAYAEGEIQAALRGEREYAPEFRVIWPDRSVHQIKAASRTFRDPDGRPVRMVGVNIDITERNQVAEELERYRTHLEELVLVRTAELATAKDAAEAANRAKTIFLANMSHEIRTPMNAVLGFAQLLQRDAALSPAARAKVDTILKSGEHLLAIINDILEMSRIEAGRAELHAEAMDLHDLLNDLTSMFRLRTQAKGLSFSLDCADNLPRHIVSDLGKLRQILSNLLGNALKFTPKGGIGLRAVPVGSDRVAIEVRDTGIGIALEEQAALFRPFARARSGEQTAAGTGLGLAISREYAHLLGGEITVESRPGEGSCFRLELAAPLAGMVPTEAVAPCRVNGLVRGQGAIRVLVVDDVRTNRELLREMLEPLGFVVDEACDGTDALAKAAANLPRVILMDLVMPGMDGCATSRILRQTLPPGSVTIIGISASAFEKDRQRFLDAGVNAFLAKPFREQDLLALFTRLAGIQFETEAVPTPAPGISMVQAKSAFDKLPLAWREAFAQALALGSIGQLQRLGEEARDQEPAFAAWMLAQVGRYDLEGLEKLC